MCAHFSRVAAGFLSLAITACVGVPARADEPVAAGFLPPGLPAVIVIRDGDRQVAAFRTLLETLRFSDSPAQRAIDANPGLVQARVGVYGLAAMAGTDPWTGAATLLGRETAIGIRPGGGKPRVIIAAVARDTKARDRLLDALHRIARLEQEGKPDETRSRMVGSVRVYHAAPELYHCRVGAALVLTNDREMMERCIEQFTTKQPGAAEDKSYHAAMRTAPPTAAIAGYLDLAAIREMLGAERVPPTQISNPLAGFLLGGWWHAIRHADQAVLWAESPTSATLRVELRLHSRSPLPESHRGFAPAAPTGMTWSATGLPRYMGEISIARDWAALFSEREALLALTAAAQVVEFSNNITTLMSQIDFASDLLPIVSGPLRLIAARQDFSAAAFDPTPRLPAFALVAPLRFPEGVGFERRLHSATQVAVSTLSLISAQQGNPPFLIDTDRYRDYRIFIAEYADPHEMEMMRQKMSSDRSSNQSADDGAGLARGTPQTRPHPPAATGPTTRLAGVRYNFSPAVALIEDQYVIATSQALLHDIIDAIVAAKAVRGGAAQVSAPPDRVHLSGPELHALLRENYEELVTNQMLEQDKPRAEAERDIDALLALAAFGEQLSLHATRDASDYAATLELHLRPAGSEGGR